VLVLSGRDRADRLRKRKIADIVRLTAALERGLAGDLHRIFNRIARHAAKLAAQGQPWAAPGVVDHYHDAIMRAWRARQNAAAVEMARHVLRDLGQVEKGVSGAPERKFLSLIEIATSAIANWLAEWGGEKVRQITDGTKRIIRRALVKGNELNEPPRVLAKRIRDDVGGEIGLRRAQVIARTETHTAANVGADSAASATGLQLEKEWGATEDHRTRPAHAAADGQRVPNSGVFVVGGEAMRFPGDPNGSAWNVINCRCVLLHRPVLPVARPAQPVPQPQPPAPAPSSAPAPALTQDQALAKRVVDKLIKDGYFNRSARKEAAGKIKDEFAGLTADQVLLVRWYTGGGFININQNLRYDRRVESLDLAAEALSAALETIAKPYTGQAIRRVAVSGSVADELAEYRDALARGRGVRFKAFTSTSVYPQEFSPYYGGYDKAQIMDFLIESKTGKYIQPLSEYSNEKEVLFRPGREFEVVAIDTTTVPPRVVLRESDFTTDAPLEKALPPTEPKARRIDWSRWTAADFAEASPHERARHWIDKMSSGYA
jgi:hypothetical protein